MTAVLASVDLDRERRPRLDGRGGAEGGDEKGRGSSRGLDLRRTLREERSKVLLVEKRRLRGQWLVLGVKEG